MHQGDTCTDAYAQVLTGKIKHLLHSGERQIYKWQGKKRKAVRDK